MSRVFSVYSIPGSSPHVQASTSTSATFTAPTNPDAVGCLISVSVNDAYVTFDGTTPSSTNGLVLKAATNPVFFPLGQTIKVTPATASTTVNVLWLT